MIFMKAKELFWSYESYKQCVIKELFDVVRPTSMSTTIVHISHTENFKARYKLVRNIILSLSWPFRGDLRYMSRKNILKNVSDIC